MSTTPFRSALTALGLLLAAARPASAQPPNFVFILVD